MIIINVMVRGQSRPVELVMGSHHGVYEVLRLFERDSDMIQYKLSTSAGSITDLGVSFGWCNHSWSKFVTEFDWTKEP